MEALQGDKFERDFGREGLSEQDAEKLGHLVQGLHRLDTGLVGKRADKIKALVEANMEKCGITAKDLEGIWNSRGGYGMLLLHWWGVAFPDWLKKNWPSRFPLGEGFTWRVMGLILRTLHLTPKTEMMAKTGFCHADLWSANLLRKGEKILAINFETANVAPAFVDLGSLLFNWGIHFQLRKPSYLDRRRREVLIESYIGGPIKEEDVESLLFNLEIGFVHRYVYVLLFNMMHSKEEEIKLVEMAERMLEAMERGGGSGYLQSDIVERGVFLSC